MMTIITRHLCTRDAVATAVLKQTKASLIFRAADDRFLLYCVITSWRIVAFILNVFWPPPPSSGDKTLRLRCTTATRPPRRSRR